MSDFNPTHRGIILGMSLPRDRRLVAAAYAEGVLRMVHDGSSPHDAVESVLQGAPDQAVRDTIAILHELIDVGRSALKDKMV